MKTYNYENFHEVEAAIVFCIDPRFWQNTLDFIQTELGIKKFDPYTYPGGPLCLARSETMDIYLNNIEAASLKLHHAKKIILISHQGCGGYKLMEGVEGEEAIKKQTEHLHSVKNHINSRFPNIIVEEYMLKILNDSELTFEKI